MNNVPWERSRGEICLVCRQDGLFRPHTVCVLEIVAFKKNVLHPTSTTSPGFTVETRRIFRTCDGKKKKNSTFFFFFLVTTSTRGTLAPASRVHTTIEQTRISHAFHTHLTDTDMTKPNNSNNTLQEKDNRERTRNTRKTPQQNHLTQKSRTRRRKSQDFFASNRIHGTITFSPSADTCPPQPEQQRRLATSQTK